MRKRGTSVLSSRWWERIAIKVASATEEKEREKDIVRVIRIVDGWREREIRLWIKTKEKNHPLDWGNRDKRHWVQRKYRYESKIYSEERDLIRRIPSRRVKERKKNRILDRASTFHWWCSTPSPPRLHLRLSSSPPCAPFLPSPLVSLSVCLLRLISSLFTSTGLELIPSLNTPLFSHSTLPSLFPWWHQTALFIFLSSRLVYLFSSKSKGKPL